MNQISYKSRYLEIISKVNKTIELIQQLEGEFKGKIKNARYLTLKESYTNQIIHFENEVKSWGVKYSIIKLSGITSDLKYFNVFLTDLDIETAQRMIPLFKIPGKITNIEFIKPGEIIFT